jgi:5-oxopent-3-ene-1,2,5-tricarboxylate decarboxylase / 2-hydroxyhepta-2,4-diene-1,7-dioate isomerase
MPPLPDFHCPPYRLSGVVVGALLNHAPMLAALGDALTAPPYKAAPKAPVLQVKPRNTWCGDGAVVGLPLDVEAVEIGASLAIVIGRTACRVAEAQALDFVAGYTIAADLSVASDAPERHYRPAVRQRARDGFCPLGPRVVEAARVPAPDALAVSVAIDGVVVHEADTGGRVRGVARLLADVSAFMTLRPGDLLLLGASHGAPRARAGQSVETTIQGLGCLHFELRAEAA